MLEEQIKRIHDKLQQLTRQHALLQKENTQLRQQLLGSREQTGQHQAQLDSLKQQVQVLRLGAGEWNSEDKKEFEKRINQYLKEIDRCIALLGE